MKIKNIKLTTKDHKSVLSAQMMLANGKKHDVYFEVDRQYKHFIFNNASPFIPIALAICMKRNEQLEIEGKISQRLLTNAPKIMKTLEGWNMGYHPISISVKGVTQKANKSKQVGCFFSGGADSFHTYLKNKKNLDHLIFVHGFDITIQDISLYSLQPALHIKCRLHEK